MQLWSGRPKVNAWGENHLWFRYRKGSKLSGLAEPRILVPDGREVSKKLIASKAISAPYRFIRSDK